MAFGRIIDLRNNTTSDILVEDIGVVLPANANPTTTNVVRITNFLSLDEINFSSDLQSLITSGDVSINGTNGDGDGTASTNLTTAEATAEVTLTTTTATAEVATGENIIVVQTSPSLGQFDSIKDAVDSITDNSDANRYRIEVAPGVYTEDTITCKSFVVIDGSVSTSVVIEPSDPDNDIFVISEGGCRLNGLTIRGATGASAAGIRVTASPITTILGGIVVSDCREHIVLETAATAAQVAILSITMISGSSTERFGRIEANGGQLTALRQYTSLIRDSDGTAFSEAYFVAGSGAQLNLNSALIESTVGVGDGVVVEDAGRVRSAAGFIIDGFDRGIVVNNTGSGSVVETSFVTVVNSGTSDLVVSHTGTTGFFNGSIAKNKTTINGDPDMSIFYSNNGVKGIACVGPIFRADTHDDLVDVAGLIDEGGTMGVIEGGTLSDGGSFDVDVSAGYGYLSANDDTLKRFEWSNTSISLSSDVERYIFFNESGVLSSSASSPNVRENIILGRVVTNSSSIHIIAQTPISGHHTGNDIVRFLRQALGSVFGSGSVVIESGTRNLDVTGGTYYFGQQVFQPSGGTAITFSTYRRDGLGGFIKAEGVTQVSNALYDDGTGTLAALTTDFYAKHTFYLIGEGVDEEYFLVFSQNEYATLVEAEEDVLPTPPGFFKDSIVLIASIIVQQGETNIVEILDDRPRLGFTASGVTASANHGNLLGLDGDDHPQYLLVDGTRAMTGDLDMGGTQDITNVSLVDGVDVSDHSDRHLPNGADPLTTAAPVDIGTANAEGNANSFARANHVHDHGVQTDGTLHAAATTSVPGFMSASDKTKLDGLGGSSVTVIVKAADETVNNSDVVQTDDDFVFAVLANSAYLFEMTLLLESAASNSDYKCAWNVPVGTTMLWGPHNQAGSKYWETPNTGVGADALLTEATVFSWGSNNVIQGTFFRGFIFTAGTAGNVAFQWAQDTAQGTDTTILQDSTTIIRQIR